MIHALTDPAGAPAHVDVFHIDHTGDADALDYALPTGWYVIGCDAKGGAIEDEPSGPFDTEALALAYGRDQTGLA